MTKQPEDLKESPADLLQACEDAFSRAYELAAGGPNYVIKVGDAEKMRLHTTDTDMDIILSRPQLRAIVSAGIAFWVERINLDPRELESPPSLVARVSDNRHLYLSDSEGDPLSPISPEETAQVSLLIAGGQPIPADLG